MNDLSPRYWKIFFEVYESLPRQGPGNRACTAQALALCRELGPSPAVLDLGCGAGTQTLYLAEWTAGVIEAVDSHAPLAGRLQGAAAERGLSHRLRVRVGDMARLDYAPGSFDLIWSEGALYNIGLRQALRLCRGWLRPGGYLAFSDAIWRKADPPAEIKAGFEMDYPAMGTLADDVAVIQGAGLEVIGHFTLPDAAWWDDFYTPMEARIAALRGHYAGDDEALGILGQLAAEPAMHRRHGDYYAYEFFVARRPLAGAPPERLG